MSPRFRGRGTALLAFAVIALLVVGGLGWITAAALSLEQEQIETRFEVDIRRALWRLDSRAFTLLAMEANRPYHEYTVSWLSQRPSTNGPTPIQVWKLNPATTDSPNWIHEQYVIFRTNEWQPAPAAMRTILEHGLGVKSDSFLPPDTAMLSSTEELLTTLAFTPLGESPDVAFVPNVPQQMDSSQVAGNLANAQQSLDRDTQARLNQASANRGQRAQAPGKGQSFSPIVDSVSFGMLTPRWYRNGTEMQLVVYRDIQIGHRSAVHVVLLVWPALRSALVDEVRDLLPGLELRRATATADTVHDRTMTALPVEMDPGPGPAHGSDAGWTPLRFGLVLSWAAALVALAAVGLGGWSLLNLSERRIGFVSAVTHELRTPLTTLRLYLDMLASGLVRDEKQKDEYIQTLNVEADRLNRLVGNVLDFSRLENHRPRLEMCTVAVADILAQVQSTWLGRCQHAAKELVIENEVGAAAIHTDVNLVSQILGNLIDNACKYSHGAEDPRIWLRARRGAGHSLCLEVEDRGAGVAKNEVRSIFRAFRRGRSENVSVGGVGLGLALAQKWASLLGGKVSVAAGQNGAGACFRVELTARTVSA